MLRNWRKAWCDSWLLPLATQTRGPGDQARGPVDSARGPRPLQTIKVIENHYAE